MAIIEGGLDQLERELVREIFMPADNQVRIDEVISQLAQRRKLHLPVSFKETGK